MEKPSNHSRRDFLQGRAAARTLVDKVRSLVDSTTELIDPAPPGKRTMLAHARRRAMACEFAVQYHVSDDVPTDDILEAFDLIDDLETQMTVYREQSQVIDINQQAADGPVEVESGLFNLLELSERLSQETAGAFDITSSPLSRVWGFMRREGRMPSDDEIETARSGVGFQHVELDSSQRTIRFLQPGVEINLNSIGKGYALDVVARQLSDLGVNNYLWHGGSSSVLARGKNRADSHQAWTLGLRHPLHPERPLAEFYLRDQALATAGGATQFFEYEGRLYSHIFDPRTGWPAAGIFTSTVIAPTAAEADALATAFFVMGADEVEEYCSKHPEVGAVLVCPQEESDDVAVLAFGLQKEDWTNVDEKPGSN
jgi:thiamine biosynthesis lipoprotein